MKKAVFIPVYPGIKNAQLLKDCGMIPYFLYKNYGMDSYMLTTRREDYSYDDKYHGRKFFYFSLFSPITVCLSILQSSK